MKVELPDVNDLFRMAKEQPAKLEELRLKMIDAIINRGDEDKRIRLSALQSKIDRIIKKSKNPLHSTILISKLMQSSVEDLNFVFENGHIRKFDNSVVIPFKNKTT